MTVSKMVTNLNRTREILSVLVVHGFGDLLQRMGLSSHLPAADTRPGAHAAGDRELKTVPRRLREALEELGGAFVKLGQLLSTRPDILPKDWIDELSHLQDDVPPLDFEKFRDTIVDDLGSISDTFESLDPTPLASASVAQVYEGKTLAGDDVVVKVRKPGVKKRILMDCDILAALAETLERHVGEARNYRPVQLVEEFRVAVTQELDFTREGQNLDRFRADFSSHSKVIFPQPYWDHTTEKILTMEKIDGVKISLIDELRDFGVETKAIAQTLAEAVIRQILEFGFVHGDPHPGNIIVVDRDRICFVDCGMVGRLDDRMRENLLMLVSAAIRKDTEAITDVLVDMEALPPRFDRPAFLRELNVFLDRYYRLPLRRIRMSSIFNDSTELINKFRIRMPSELLIVGKALITVEGIGRKLDPEFDAISVAQPFVREMVLKTYGPAYLGRKLMEGSREVIRLIRDLPSDIRELAHTLRENQLKIVIEHTGLTEAFRNLDLASKRISTSIVIASLVMGSSIIMAADAKPMFRGIPVLGIAGFAAAAVLGLWIVYTTVFKGKP
jgi:ubiquinone biosynthesis protein